MVASIVSLLVGVALFVTGMDMMSSGLKKVSGKGLKKLFEKIQNNAIAGVSIGALVTALIQSSGATSVMVIGFVNSNIMSVFQAVSLIFGAYIGSTITGLLVSLSSFKISSYLVVLAFIGVAMSFVKKEKVKNIGEILTGFGILFFGLDCMSGALNNETINSFFQQLFTDISFPFLLLLIGALFTALVQSSSATSGIVIVMVGNGLLSLSSSFYLLLGSTIGTVIVTILATFGGNTNAKRVGIICLVVKILFAILGTIVIWIFEKPISNFFATAFPTLQLSVALFFMIYNIIFVFTLLPLLRTFEKLSMRFIKDKQDDDLKASIKYIDDRLVNTPSIAVAQAQKEILNMLNLSVENLEKSYKKVINQNSEDDAFIVATEDKIDYINNQLASYLIKLSYHVNENEAKVVGSFFHVINDVERIGDYAFNFYEMANAMKENGLAFSNIAIDEFNGMYSNIRKMCDIAFEILEKEDYESLKELHNLENKTDEQKLVLSSAHYDRILKNSCKIELSPYYTSLVNDLERVADHLVNVGYSIISPTGDDPIKA